MNRLIKYYGCPGEFVCSYNVKFKKGIIVSEVLKSIEDIEAEFNVYMGVNSSCKNYFKKVITIKVPKKYNLNKIELNTKPLFFFYKYVKNDNEKYDYVIFSDDFLGTKKVLMKLNKIIDKFWYEYYEHDILNDCKNCEFPIGLKFCYKGNCLDLLVSKCNRIMNSLITLYSKI